MKDEAKFLPRLLKSILPFVNKYYILDTGSTDNSIEIVKDFFEQHGIEGEIHVNTECIEIIEGKPCFIYGKARNEALKLLEGKADYGFWIDCDEELIIEPSFNESDFKNKLISNDFDKGNVVIRGTFEYHRSCIFKVSKPFKWVGKVHEVLVCDDPTNDFNVQGMYVQLHADETDRDVNKYKQHALILQKEVDEHNSPRDIFYLANSLKDNGDWEKAIEYYRRRVNNIEGFYEERYESQFMIGNLYWTHGKPFGETIMEYFKCSELDPLRVEHLYNTIIILQNNSLWHTAYLISKSAVERFHKKSPREHRHLFLYENVYATDLLKVHLNNCQVLGILEDSNPLTDNTYTPNILNPVSSERKERKKNSDDKKVFIAILARDKEATLPLYLECIEKLDYPKENIVLYIRSNNNSDSTVKLLIDFAEKNEDLYKDIIWNFEDVDKQMTQHHDWNSDRFSVLGKIRQDSMRMCTALACDYYFVADCDNFILPNTLKSLISFDVPIIAPMLVGDNNTYYSNFHYAVDVNGYFVNNPKYYEIFARKVKDIFQVAVVHCTYLIKTEFLDKLVYNDGSRRHEYVIFSDSARKNNIPQYIDNTEMYGMLTFKVKPEEMEGVTVDTMKEKIQTYIAFKNG